MITKRQKEVLDYLESYQNKRGYAPTLEDIRKHFKFASVSTAHHHVTRLTKEGLIHRDDNQPRAITPKDKLGVTQIKILGTIAAGQPIEAIESADETISLSQSDISTTGDHYALRVAGDSMIGDGIFDGDIVVIRKQHTAGDGQTVVAIINENEATLKRIYKEKNGYRLQPANQSMLPLFSKEVEIRGVVVKIIRNFRDESSLSSTTSLSNHEYQRMRRTLEELNHQQYHFVNSNDICTPMGCVEEMVDSIPESFWKKENLKVLDPCAGNGNFHAYIQTKTDLKNLVFNDINEKRLVNVRRLFGAQAKITKQDFFEYPNKEEYDLVVANPPYAKFTNGERTAKNHNLSRGFILKALSITKPGGYILFIVPDNWMSFADSNKVPSLLSQYQFIHLDIHGAKKWFPKVGSSFTWFLLKKAPNEDEFTVKNSYKMSRTEKATLDTGSDFIPLYYSKQVQSIVKKTIGSGGSKYPIETSSNLHKYTQKSLLSDVQDTKHKYKVHHTPSQIVWSAKPHKYHDGWKVFISLTNQYGTFIDKDCGMTQSIAFIRCSTKGEAEEISKQLNDPIYKFLNNVTRYGNFNNIRVLQNFPTYRDFKLSKKELDFVNEFNNNYYRKTRLVM